MERDFYKGLNLGEIETPVFVVSEDALRENCQILDSVQRRTGCKILLALKGYAMHSTFPLIRNYLHGVCASSPHEARLGREEFGREVHSFAAAYSDRDFDELLELSDHIVFNSFGQYERFRDKVLANQGRLSFGLRVNPEHSEAPVAMYDPCGFRSRLGIRRENFGDRLPEGISGLHFHTLCEQNSDALERTAESFEEKFAPFLDQVSWLNFGGGHHITKPGYDIDLLCRVVSRFMERYGVMVYLEPGEAVGLNTGILVSTVLDVVHNDIDIAIIDASAAAHMPDVLEMPYRPGIAGAGEPGELAYTCRIGGLSCLAGDIVGEYSFPGPLKPGDRIVLLDMAHYTMVKTNTFNGIRLPSIALHRSPSEKISIVKEFGYDDFRERLS